MTSMYTFSDVPLSGTSLNAINYTLAASTGTFIETGNTAMFGLAVAASTGTFIETGNVATFNLVQAQRISLTADFGVFVLSDQTATFNIPQYPVPRITFQVRLLDLQQVASSEPDSLSNIINGLRQRTIQIPGVAGDRFGNLHDGDQFVLYGNQALYVKNAYKDYLLVIANE